MNTPFGKKFTICVYKTALHKLSDLVHWEDLEGWGGEGGGRGDRVGNTCKPMAVSFQCMTKSTTIKKKRQKRNSKQSEKKKNKTALQNGKGMVL